MFNQTPLLFNLQIHYDLGYVVYVAFLQSKSNWGKLCFSTARAFALRYG